MEKIDKRNPALKIVITGPESTGKTTLCKVLANYYETSYAPEYTRKYLQHKNGIYMQEDLRNIAEGQIKLEEEHLQMNKHLLICDTSLEVIRIWSEWKYKNCDPYILEQAKTRLPDLFLLLTPDLPWQPDPLRENPDDREALFAYYQKSLKEYQTKVVEISGDFKTRMNSSIKAIDEILKKDNP